MRVHHGVWAGLAIVCVVAGGGCDRNALQLSVSALDFGDTETVLQFEVYNANPRHRGLDVSLSFEGDAITLDPGKVISAAPLGESGPFDKTTVLARLDRSALDYGPFESHITINGRGIRKRKLPVYAMPPFEAIDLSTKSVNLGQDENYATITVANSNKKREVLRVTAVADSPWIDVSRATIVAKRGENVMVVVGVKRSRLTPGLHEGRVLFEAEGFITKTLEVSVVQPYQAIMTSNDVLNFGLNPQPMLIDVWNSNDVFERLTIQAVPSLDWIEVRPGSVTSVAPVSVVAPASQEVSMVNDKRQIVVSINRTRLSVGDHEGVIMLQADSEVVAPRIITVKVRQDQDIRDTAKGLRIENVFESQTPPYLVEFAFGLSSDNGVPVVAEPGQLNVEVFENGEDMTPLVRPVLRRGAARQLRVEIVMDYSFGMRSRPSAVAAMEHAAADLFVPKLPEDTLVGVTLYDRDDRAPIRVVPFTLDHGYVADRIRAIRDEVVGEISSGARMLDALRQAALLFDTANKAREERIILLFAGTGDTSSYESETRVVNAAKNRHVRIYAVSMVSDAHAAPLMLNLAEKTGGEYFPADAVSELPSVANYIAARIEGNYLLRWASLKRNDRDCIPAFTIGLPPQSASYTGTAFYPILIGGDVLAGRLRLIESRTGDRVSALVRADYIPREITRFRLLLDTDLDFEVTRIEAAEGGIAGHWDISGGRDETTGALVIDLTSPTGTPLPFAAFGGLLRFDFHAVPQASQPLFHYIFIDNDVEEYWAGQYFTLDFL